MLKLVNSADCDVAYELAYVITYTPTTDTTTSNSRDARTVLPLQASNSNSSSSSVQPKLIIADVPCGVLSTRSHKHVNVTLQPQCDGDYSLTLLCRVSVLDSSGKQTMLAPQELQLVELGRKDRLNAATATASTAAEYTPLQCVVTARSSFPRLLISDVRADTTSSSGSTTATSTPNLWTSLSISGVNTLLAQPLTPAEVVFNAQSSPDRSFLQRFPTAFLPATVGTKAQSLLLQLHNPGLLAVAFSVHFPNERDIEMEQWATEGDATVEDLRQNDIIDRLQLFEVWPRSGQLQPGESVTLRLAYNYSRCVNTVIHRANELYVVIVDYTVVIFTAM
jgi:hypothetical protein